MAFFLHALTFIEHFLNRFHISINTHLTYKVSSENNVKNNYNFKVILIFTLAFLITLKLRSFSIPPLSLFQAARHSPPRVPKPFQCGIVGGHLPVAECDGHRSCGVRVAQPFRPQPLGQAALEELQPWECPLGGLGITLLTSRRLQRWGLMVGF